MRNSVEYTFSPIIFLINFLCSVSFPFFSLLSSKVLDLIVDERQMLTPLEGYIGYVCEGNKC